MIVCGLKLTHDSSIAIIEDGVLRFCIELEKINNNNRYRIVHSLEEIEEILDKLGYPLKSIDKIVVDGWVGNKTSSIKTTNLDSEIHLSVAPYHENLDQPVLTKYSF